MTVPATGEPEPVMSPATRPSTGSTTMGASASPAHASAASAIPASIVGGLSRAVAAASLRGRARNPTPNALTNVATARPAVSATAATASGNTIAVATPGAGSPWISDCSSTHSLTNAVPGGSADAASAPSPNIAVVIGMTRRRPPRASRSRVPVARSTDPAARNSSVLNAAWPMMCSSAAVSASAAGTRLPVAVNSPLAPIPTNARPMFSVVEYASSRFRSVLITACRIPYTAERAPSASTSSHHQLVPPPIRSNPTRTIP